MAVVGGRIIKHLPQTGLRYRLFLTDTPEVNGYNLPGGYAAVPRKPVAFARFDPGGATASWS